MGSEIICEIIMGRKSIVLIPTAVVLYLIQSYHHSMLSAMMSMVCIHPVFDGTVPYYEFVSWHPDRTLRDAELSCNLCLTFPFLIIKHVIAKKLILVIDHKIVYQLTILTCCENSATSRRCNN
jgi:hypothetical protein